MTVEPRLGEFEALVLAAVVRAGENANGSGVYEQMVETAGPHISLAAVHVTLRRLEEKHLLTSATGTSSDRGGRPRRFYTATPQGLRALTVFRDLWRRAFRGLTLPDGSAS
jgi:DNA-binding PadR family transcriptional regulator